MNRDSRRAAVVAGLYSPPDPNPDNPAALALAAVRTRMLAIGRVARAIADAGRAAMATFQRALKPLYESFQRAGLAPPLAADDPAGHALWLRQHRHTGPAVPVPAYRPSVVPPGLSSTVRPTRAPRCAL